MKTVSCQLLTTLLGFQRGHDWKLVWAADKNTKGATAVVCRRCGESGWQL